MIPQADLLRCAVEEVNEQNIAHLVQREICPVNQNGHGHERVRVVAKVPLDDVLQAVQILDGFRSRVEASGGAHVQVDVLRAFLHRVPDRHNRDLVIAVDLVVRLRVSCRNLLRRNCLDAFAAFTTAHGRGSLRQHRLCQDDCQQLR